MNRSMFLARLLIFINLVIFLVALKLYSEKLAEKASQSAAPAVISIPHSTPSKSR